MQNYPFTLESMIGGTLRVPAVKWGLEWAQGQFPQSWETETYLCTVTHHQKKVKNLGEGLWVLYKNEERIHLLTEEVVEILERGTTVALKPLYLHHPHYLFLLAFFKYLFLDTYKHIPRRGSFCSSTPLRTRHPGWGRSWLFAQRSSEHCNRRISDEQAFAISRGGGVFEAKGQEGQGCPIKW